jgi:hypothetical protein
MPYVEKNEVFSDDDEVLLTGKKNVSPSPDPLPNGMRIKNDKKKSHSYDLQINPEFFGFHNRLAPHASLPDNLYFERLKYFINNN